MTSTLDHSEEGLTAPTVKGIAQAVLADISQHFHFNSDAWWYLYFNKFAMLPAKRFGKLMQKCDLNVPKHGLWKVARALLPYFTSGWDITGEASLPKEGPLLIASNHPGAVDSIAALAAVERPDVHLLALSRPTLKAMTNTSKHILYFNEHNPARFGLIRRLIAILKRGEAILMFPNGTLEPDPSLYHGALDSLKHWSESLGLFLSRVPETMFQLILTQSVLTPRAWNNPIARLGKSDKQRHQIGMILQAAVQQILGAWKIPVKTWIPAPVPVKKLAEDLNPHILNLEIERYVGGEMEKAFEKL
jgi:1-acyl-sn-glycerol-3-phosphate acyltransferase